MRICVLETDDDSIPISLSPSLPRHVPPFSLGPTPVPCCFSPPGLRRIAASVNLPTRRHSVAMRAEKQKTSANVGSAKDGKQDVFLGVKGNAQVRGLGSNRDISWGKRLCRGDPFPSLHMSILPSPISPILPAPISPILPSPISPVLPSPISPILPSPISPILPSSISLFPPPPSTYTLPSSPLVFFLPSSL